MSFVQDINIDIISSIFILFLINISEKSFMEASFNIFLLHFSSIVIAPLIDCINFHLPLTQLNNL